MYLASCDWLMTKKDSLSEHIYSHLLSKLRRLRALDAWALRCFGFNFPRTLHNNAIYNMGKDW
jgi:hypothetical protein